MRTCVSLQNGLTAVDSLIQRPSRHQEHILCMPPHGHRESACAASTRHCDSSTGIESRLEQVRSLHLGKETYRIPQYSRLASHRISECSSVMPNLIGSDSIVGILRGTVRLLLVVSSFFFSAGPSNALLVSVDLNTPNDGLLTVDTNTNLSWLDLTATRGQSYDTIVSGYGGYFSLGFRYATTAEVSALWLNVGVTRQQGLYYPENEPGASLLVNLMGCTNNCGFGTDGHQGLAEGIPFNALLAKAPYIALSPDRAEGFAVLLGSTIPKSSSFSSVGSYLVRPIPEPTSSLLIVVGLLCLAAKRPKAARVTADRESA